MTERRADPEGARPKRGNFGPFFIVAVGATAIFILLAAGLNPWNVLFINPLINALVLLDIFVLGQFGLAILLFTMLLRLATIPFTLRQLESTRAMQAAQPQMQELNKKYKDPKRRNEEMLKLYREYNINPLGCFMPLLIQMVVFIALNSALRHMVGGNPESLLSLSQRLYPWSFLHTDVPLRQHFLWLNLGNPDSTFILPLLVGASTYVQQKMSVTPATNPQQAQQQQMMTWMMPMMLIFFTLNLPSGVGVYWVTSNIFSLFASYYVYGRRAISWRQILLPTPAAAPAPTKRPRKEPDDDSGAAAAVRGKGPRGPGPTSAEIKPPREEAGAPAPADKARSASGKRRGKRKNRR